MNNKITSLCGVVGLLAASQSALAVDNAFSGISDFGLGAEVSGNLWGQTGGFEGFQGAYTATFLTTVDAGAITPSAPNGTIDPPYAPGGVVFNDLYTTNTSIIGGMSGNYSIPDEPVDPLVGAKLGGDTFAAVGINDAGNKFNITGASASSAVYGYTQGGSADAVAGIGSCAHADSNGVATPICVMQGP